MKLSEFRLTPPGEHVTLSGVGGSQREQKISFLPEATLRRPDAAQADEGPGHCRPRGVSSSSMRASWRYGENAGQLHHSLGALVELYQAHSSMEAVLLTASRLVVEMLNLDHCSVGWVDGQDFGFRVWTSHTREGADVNPNQAARALANFARHDRPERKGVPQSSAPGGPDNDSRRALELTAPLRLDGQIVGYLYALNSRLSDVRFFDTDRSLFVAMSQHINSAIEVQRSRQRLDCPYFELALGPHDKGGLANAIPGTHTISDSVGNSEELAPKIARRFFGDLRRAGFETKQILSITTEILDSMNEVLRTTKSR